MTDLERASHADRPRLAETSPATNFAPSATVTKPDGAIWTLTFTVGVLGAPRPYIVAFSNPQFGSFTLQFAQRVSAIAAWRAFELLPEGDYTVIMCGAHGQTLYSVSGLPHAAYVEWRVGLDTFTARLYLTLAALRRHLRICLDLNGDGELTVVCRNRDDALAESASDDAVEFAPRLRALGSRTMETGRVVSDRPNMEDRPRQSRATRTTGIPPIQTPGAADTQAIQGVARIAAAADSLFRSCGGRIGDHVFARKATLAAWITKLFPPRDFPVDTETLVTWASRAHVAMLATPAATDPRYGDFADRMAGVAIAVYGEPYLMSFGFQNRDTSGLSQSTRLRHQLARELHNRGVITDNGRFTMSLGRVGEFLSTLRRERTEIEQADFSAFEAALVAAMVRAPELEMARSSETETLSSQPARIEGRPNRSIDVS